MRQPDKMDGKEREKVKRPTPPGVDLWCRLGISTLREPENLAIKYVELLPRAQ
jgi:hypothetical protein